MFKASAMAEKIANQLELILLNLESVEAKLQTFEDLFERMTSLEKGKGSQG